MYVCIYSPVGVCVLRVGGEVWLSVRVCARCVYVCITVHFLRI